MARNYHCAAALALFLTGLAHAQPSAPGALSAQPGNAQVELTWADPSNDAISHYSVRYATDPAAFSGSTPPEWHAISGSDAETVRHTAPNLTNGTRYYFQIRAADADGDSGPSNTATIRLAASPTAAVTIGDANLREQLEIVLEKTAGAAITQLDMATLAHFGAWSAGVSAVTALQHAVNLASLDLSDNRISDVTPLMHLTALQELFLDRNRVSDVTALGHLTSLAYLGLSNNRISDITALGRLESLQELRLGNNSISNVAPLAKLALLDDLHLNDNNISDVTALGGLAALQELNLDGNSISDLTALGRLARLLHLWLNGNAISDVTALGNLARLKGLDLGNNSIADLTALGRLTGLAQLSLGSNNISDVTALGRLTNLQGLYLSDNNISDVTALGRLKDNLLELFLSNNDISDITALGSLRALGQLWLNGNDITRVWALAPLRALLVLNLDDNDISDLTSFRSLGTLGGLRLHLSNNDITYLTALGDLTGLEFLYLNDNNISDVTALGNLDELFWLELDGNDIADVTALGGLRSLGYVSLDNNAVSDVTALGRLTTLRGLSLRNNGISDATSFGQLTLVNSIWPRTTLDLGDNSIADVTALGSLTTLEDLRLDGNDVADVAALGNLTELEVLRLGDNNITDVSPLGQLALIELTLDSNAITDVTALGSLTALQALDLARNDISDATELARLQSLRRLRLDDNHIADAGSLLGGHLGEGDVVGLRGNPLSAASIERHVPALRATGAAVLAGRLVPLFPSAADATGRQGFVRVLNRSATAGEVFIDAVDDAGVYAGPVRLAVGAGAAAHFNSDDFEGGNAMKGLPEGVGKPTAGGWRLALLSSLDIEVLAYIRTPDGFLTSVHDTLPRDEQTSTLNAAIFNPGRNRAQRSSLRLVNAGVGNEFVLGRGVDDSGSVRQTRIEVSTGAVALTAAQLERHRSGGEGLGRGAGKWRLDVEAPWWVEAMSLLASPSGHLTNLSTTPAPSADGVWRVPLFPAASSSAAERAGFVRIANHGPAGEAAVVAVDDGGVRVGPVALRLGARQTTHFNSQDLEQGNAAKGLPVGVGTPTQGDWRLQITSASDIRVTSFVRAAGGFLTSMHDVAPAEGNVHRVVFFNPAGNTQQQSLLRLVNEGDTAANVTVTGVDDAARPGGEVRTTIPAGRSISLTATQLEEGGDGLSGRLGDGVGKWRLRVESNRPLSVMSLLESPSGHLTNLSTAGV